MPYTLEPWKKNLPLPSFTALRQPIAGIIDDAPPLTARGNRHLQMTFEQQLNSLIFFHLEEHTSGRHLVQVLAEDDLGPEGDRSTRGHPKEQASLEAVNTRGLEQLLYVLAKLATSRPSGTYPRTRRLGRVGRH